MRMQSSTVREASAPRTNSRSHCSEQKTFGNCAVELGAFRGAGSKDKILVSRPERVRRQAQLAWLRRRPQEAICEHRTCWNRGIVVWIEGLTWDTSLGVVNALCMPKPAAIFVWWLYSGCSLSEPSLFAFSRSTTAPTVHCEVEPPSITPDVKCEQMHR